MKGTLDMTENSKESMLTRCADTTSRDARNLKRMLWILMAWAVAFLAVTQGLKRGVLATEGPMLWLAAAVPTAAGIWVISAYARYLRHADELQRVIHYQALALGFGAGWLAVSASAIFERSGAPLVGAEMITLAMVGVYSIWIVFGQLRYR